LTIAVCCIYAFINLVIPHHLPAIEKTMGFVHGLGWMAAVVILAVLAPHPPARAVFLEFSTFGWKNMGISVLVGQITSVYFLILSDSAAHLSEEVRLAATSVPKAMMWSFCLNSLGGFIVLITFLFSLDSVENALADPTFYPYMYVFRQASDSGAIAITVLMILVFIFANTGSNASTSRQTFAFARDHGLPFDTWLAKVSTRIPNLRPPTPLHLNPRNNRTHKFFSFPEQHPEANPSQVSTKNHIPANAVILTCIITILLSLINLGSTAAFNAIISLQLMALMATYLLSIGSVLWRRTRSSDPLPPARFSLGRYGTVVNGIGFFYSGWSLFWAAWPGVGGSDLTVTNMNWAPVMFVGVMGISLVFYWTGARGKYKGPVVLVRS